MRKRFAINATRMIVSCHSSSRSSVLSFHPLKKDIASDHDLASTLFVQDDDESLLDGQWNRKQSETRRKPRGRAQSYASERLLAAWSATSHSKCYNPGLFRKKFQDHYQVQHLCFWCLKNKEVLWNRRSEKICHCALVLSDVAPKIRLI